MELLGFHLRDETLEERVVNNYPNALSNERRERVALLERDQYSNECELLDGSNHFASAACEMTQCEEVIVIGGTIKISF